MRRRLGFEPAEICGCWYAAGERSGPEITCATTIDSIAAASARSFAIRFALRVAASRLERSSASAATVVPFARSANRIRRSACRLAAPSFSAWQWRTELLDTKQLQDMTVNQHLLRCHPSCTLFGSFHLQLELRPLQRKQAGR
jgi:hypothetical protein